jgi:ubiquinone/menaquinone biosynthesis C-methylase UbiE
MVGKTGVLTHPGSHPFCRVDGISSRKNATGYLVEGNMPDRKRDRPRITWNPKNTFAGTAWFYARYRPGYPDEVFQLLRKRFGLDRSSRVLDLGSGTGQIALPIAPYVAEVVAVDPMEDMLKEAKEQAVTRHITNINWLLGESGNLGQMSNEIGEIDLTVIARAFHWMDREQTLKDLYSITKHGGGIALISDSGLRDSPGPYWKEIINRTVKQWLGEERKAGTQGTYSHPTERFETVLQQSAFQNLEIADFHLTRSWSINQIIGYLYSTSSSSLPVLGDKKEAFEADIRAWLAELEPSGQFKEQVTFEVMMVWKPAL